MISLSRHIELLLLEHDCIIVPGLGGFIANHQEAQYEGDEEALFLPPYRTIRFNQQLQMNDGLLVQSYMTAYDASYPAAYMQMEADIEKVIHELEMHGEVALDRIGALKKDINGSVVFVASTTSVLTPSLYGLHSYEIKSLSSVIKAREVEEALNAASAMAVNTGRGEKGKKVAGESKSISRRHWIDIGISVAAAIVLMFCISYPTLKNTASDTDTVVATFYQTNEVKAKPRKTTETEESKKETETKMETFASEKKAAEELPTESEPKFSLVLASYVSKPNAENFIENLSKQGFKEGRYVKNDKVSRILYSNYKDEEEARQALLDLRQQCNEFADAWILEL